MSAVSVLFRMYTEGFTIGELPKDITEEYVELKVSNERMRELGYVQLSCGEWVYHKEAVQLPAGGKLVWTRRG